MQCLSKLRAASAVAGLRGRTPKKNDCAAGACARAGSLRCVLRSGEGGKVEDDAGSSDSALSPVPASGGARKCILLWKKRASVTALTNVSGQHVRVSCYVRRGDDDEFRYRRSKGLYGILPHGHAIDCYRLFRKLTLPRRYLRLACGVRARTLGCAATRRC